jgi:hypothetical protein
MVLEVCGSVGWSCTALSLVGTLCFILCSGMNFTAFLPDGCGCASCTGVSELQYSDITVGPP